MFVEFEADMPKGQSKKIAINPDHIVKVEQSHLGMSNEIVTLICYVDGQSDAVKGDWQTTLKRLNGDYDDVTSLG